MTQKVWYLATVDDEGNPHVRPFGAQAIPDDKLYIGTGLKKNVAKQMIAHPQVEISWHGKRQMDSFGSYCCS